ncbi:hypothetical protein QQZ08_003020 [Neonectria magnoliae]|uniref:Uncharacterized protein n=1 Tax=Neonectria magnoliae TaxID=2732573 RepID=A0ABR1ICD4_9HYPO
MGPEDHELRSIDTLRDGMPDPNPLAPRHDLVKEGRGEGVRHRKRAAFLLIFYLPILLLPWIFTAVMMLRPINFSLPTSTRTAPSRHDIWARWRNGKKLPESLGMIAATLGLPIVSALLAYGAVVYTQRRKAGQDLNALQMFTLADRTWMDFPGLWKAVRSPARTSTVFLYLAAGLIFITAVQPPLQ